MNGFGAVVVFCVLLVGAVCACIRKVRMAGVTMLVASIAVAAWQWQKEERWSRGFASVRDGASMEEVVATLGRPTIAADSDKPPFGYSLATPTNGVRKELWYVSWFAPEQFDFGFDGRGILVVRYHYVSP